MLPIVAKRLVLHIGAMKSGTSFIQNVLRTTANRERLAEHGILFACDRWREQVLAVRELIDRGGPGQEPITPNGPWQHLVDVVERVARDRDRVDGVPGTAEGTEDRGDQGGVPGHRPPGGAHCA